LLAFGLAAFSLPVGVVYAAPNPSGTGMPKPSVPLPTKRRAALASGRCGAHSIANQCPLRVPSL